MALGTSMLPTRGFAHFNSLVYPKRIVTSKVLSTAGGVVTLTPAELLGGILVLDVQEAQTLTLPTAAALNAAIPGVQVGTSFEVDIVNYGDSLLTVGLGAGITKTTIAGVAPVMTVATVVSKRLLFLCTGVLLQGSAADAWVVYSLGSSVAAVA